MLNSLGIWIVYLLTASPMVALFIAVVLLIVDLNRSQEGALNVSEQAMIDLPRQLQGVAL